MLDLWSWRVWLTLEVPPWAKSLVPSYIQAGVGFGQAWEPNCVVFAGHVHREARSSLPHEHGSGPLHLHRFLSSR